MKNRNYFWYEGKKHEQAQIRQCLRRKLQEGIHILYSGNPLVWEPDLIVLPDKELRWERVSARSGFRPTKENFMREQMAYERASRLIPTFSTMIELEEYLRR